MRLLVLLSMITLLSACSTPLKPINNGHGTTEGIMGETIQEVSAYGLITQVAAEEGLVNIKHGPIPELNWAPMLMTFRVSESLSLEPFKAGDKVSFILELDEKGLHRLKYVEIRK
ncbi:MULTISPECIES: copper-binding protein, partial [unclassified Oleiphilus]|uniref:copper-binding protein n=1 Tax=unclassified Oleiphilus TaxID=2631174 RepID=UPI0007C37237